jgi:hypothetical protein
MQYCARMSRTRSQPARHRISWAEFAYWSWWPTILAVVWLVVICLAAMAPTLAHGTKLGPYDLLSEFGLGKVPHATVHNTVSSDQIQQFAPWTDIAWKAVHGGHLPLWNPYNAMGTPLAFNLQSATFSLPMLVAYLAPLRFAYTTFVLVKIVLAGTGLLFFCRVMGLGAFAGAFAGTVFELSGAFGGWAGWPMATVLCMLGWVLGSGVLTLSRTRGWRYLPLLALTIAFAAYGGHPESLVILLVVLAITVVVVVLSRAREEGTAVLWTTGRAALGVLAGLALAAPLLLPGLQAVKQSAASGRAGYGPAPLRYVVNLVVAGYEGFPTLHSSYFGALNYYETAAFVGVTVLVLAAVALTYHWRNPVIVGLVVAALFLSAAVWLAPMAHLLDHIPGAKLIVWRRGVIVVDGILAVLAAFGLQLVRDQGGTKTLGRRLLVAAAAGCLLLLGLVVRQLHGQGVAHAIRDHSLLWPCISGVVTLAVALGLLRWSRVNNRRAAHARPSNSAGLVGAVVLFAVECAFLLTAVPHLWSSSTQIFATTPAEHQLQILAGDQRVGFGQCPKPVQLAPLGILPGANAAYGVRELGMYDAVLPKTYLPTYARLSHTPVVKPVLGNFCPSMTTSTLARQYGVSYVLEPAHAPVPPGTVPDGTIDGEGVFRVPGGSIVTLQPQDAPADDAQAEPVALSDADPQHLGMVVDAGSSSRLDIHIGNFPGWTATLDGRPLALHPFLTDEMQATIPSGHHVIELQYRPKAFEVGLVLATATLLALIVGWLLQFMRRRRKPTG